MHPYVGLDSRAYWKTAVSALSPLAFEDIYRPKVEITRQTRIGAAGSCFAQHIGRQFKQRGYHYLDKEPAPPMMAQADRARFGYDIYSARHGNLYSMRQMVQLLRRARGEFTPAETAWEQDGRWYDPFRPAIQPGGFASRDELETDVAHHLAKVLELVNDTQLQVFTFGLTECWQTRADGAALPTCPGTVAGAWDADKYTFVNYDYGDVMADVDAFIALGREHNPQMEFLFTVSPVPLTATATGGHVLPASVYSKSVLRAVCGALEQKHSFVDYFPSYELVASHPMRAMFFEPNLRAVSPVGVGHVMDTFFAAHGDTGEAVAGAGPAQTAAARAMDLVCEEEALEANAT